MPRVRKPRPLARPRHQRATDHAIVVHVTPPFRLIDTSGFRVLRHAMRPWLKRVKRNEPGYRFCPLHPNAEHHAPGWNVWMEWSE